MRGYNYLMMDGVDDTYSAGSVATGVRWAVGDTVSYANRMSMASVTPDATAYMLSGGGKYLRLTNGSTTFTPTNGTYSVEWWEIITRTVHSASNVTVTGSTTFTPPVGGDVVLFLQPSGGGSAPSAPTLGSLTPGNTQITVTWSGVAGATGYKVKYGTSSGSYGTTVDVGNVTSHTVTSLTNGTTYYFVIVAYNGGGDSSNSNEQSAAPSSTSRIQTKYNDMAAGDVVFLEKLFTFEAMSVQQHSSPDAGKVYKSVTVNGQAGYEFEVTRNLDGTGKNDWLAGDSYVNTGSPGNGFIDQYSYTSVLARPLEFIALDGALIDSFAVDFTLLSGSGGIAAFGMSVTKFDALHLTLKVPAAYTTATIAYEYWNGSAWTALSVAASARDANNAVVTADWKTPGTLSVVWTPPGDWSTTTIASQTAYWMRVRVSAATGWSQNPKQGGGKWVTRGKRRYGPTIAFWRRMSSTWNDLREGGALGNLEGFHLS